MTSVGWWAGYPPYATCSIRPRAGNGSARAAPNQAVLALQRAAGNRAVTDLVHRAAGRTLQRAPAAPAPVAMPAGTQAQIDLYVELQSATPDVARVTALATAVVNGGQSLNWINPQNGDLLLGVAAKMNTDPTTAALQALVAAGASVAARDGRGRNALHYAAYGGRQMNAQYLIGAGVAVESRDNAGWTAYDVASAAGQHALAAHLAPLVAAAPGGRDPRELDLAPGPHSATEILAAATKSMDPLVHWGQLKAMYDELYRYDDLRPILDVAALEARTSRAVNPAALRIYLSDDDSAFRLRAGGGHGSYNDMDKRAGPGQPITQKREGTITTGGVRAAASGISGENVMLGTLIHELTHHAAMKVSGNNVIPIQRGNVTQLKSYLAGYRADASRPTSALAPLTQHVREVGFERIHGYQSLATKLPEIIVRAPQTLIETGQLAEQAIPGIIGHFRNTFLPAVRAFTAGHANSAQLQRSPRPVVPTSPSAVAPR